MILQLFWKLYSACSVVWCTWDFSSCFCTRVKWKNCLAVFDVLFPNCVTCCYCWVVGCVNIRWTWLLTVCEHTLTGVKHGLVVLLWSEFDQSIKWLLLLFSAVFVCLSSGSNPLGTSCVRLLAEEQLVMSFCSKFLCMNVAWTSGLELVVTLFGRMCAFILKPNVNEYAIFPVGRTICRVWYEECYRYNYSPVQKIKFKLLCCIY